MLKEPYEHKEFTEEMFMATNLLKEPQIRQSYGGKKMAKMPVMKKAAPKPMKEHMMPEGKMMPGKSHDDYMKKMMGGKKGKK